MPRISSSAKIRTEAFSELQKASAKLGETNDCTVKAIAVVTGITYEEAHKLCVDMGRKRHRGMYQHQYHTIIRALGFTIERINTDDIQAKYSRAKTGGYRYKNLTSHHVALYPEAWNDGHVYLVGMRGHVGAVRDGKLHDWTVGSSRRIVSVYRVTKNV